jgi:hypothetical protein
LFYSRRELAWRKEDHLAWCSILQQLRIDMVAIIRKLKATVRYHGAAQGIKTKNLELGLWERGACRRSREGKKFGHLLVVVKL